MNISEEISDVQKNIEHLKTLHCPFAEAQILLLVERIKTLKRFMFIHMPVDIKELDY